MKLLFVYNASSGAVNALLDGAHKILIPSTYPCHLCKITYGTFLEKKAWKAFRKTSGIDMIFLHKDEFLNSYSSKWLPKFTFPIILLEEKGQLDVLVPPDTLKAIKNASGLILAIQKNLS